MKIILKNENVDLHEKIRVRYYENELEKEIYENKLYKPFYVITCILFIAMFICLGNSIFSNINNNNIIGCGILSFLSLVAAFYILKIYKFFINRSKKKIKEYNQLLDDTRKFCDLLRRHFRGEVCIHESDGYTFKYYEISDKNKETQILEVRDLANEKYPLPPSINNEDNRESILSIDALTLWTTKDEQDFESVTFVK